MWMKSSMLPLTVGLLKLMLVFCLFVCFCFLAQIIFKKENTADMIL